MHTNIYATFGPSCRDREVLSRMIDAGLSGMRLNLSHMTLPMAAEYISAYRQAAAEAGASADILIDMQGPELRVGEVDAELTHGDRIILGTGGIPVPDIVIPYLVRGRQVLLDDAKILVTVIHNEGTHALCDVVRGGHLSSRKSLKIKDVYVDMPPLTGHDISNIRLAAQYGVSAVMQPFVRSGEELIRVREMLDANRAEGIKIYAKIENMQGVENIDSILPHADMIVIARGDLGNDMHLWQLPAVQKRLEQACHRHGTPYIVVTQMLDSMTASPMPTRAEVSDIFHAVYHGAAGVMITGESAVGAYPAEAVEYLARTARSAEEYMD